MKLRIRSERNFLDTIFKKITQIYVHRSSISQFILEMMWFILNVALVTMTSHWTIISWVIMYMFEIMQFTRNFVHCHVVYTRTCTVSNDAINYFKLYKIFHLVIVQCNVKVKSPYQTNLNMSRNEVKYRSVNRKYLLQLQ